jgi:ferrous iron transport protein A
VVLQEEYEDELQFHLWANTVRPDADISTRPQRLVTSLDRAPRSEWVEVVELPRGRGASRHLRQVGICVNERLRVLSTAPLGGPVLVEAGGTTVAIGRSLASRITVRLMRSGHNGETP